MARSTTKATQAPSLEEIVAKAVAAAMGQMQAPAAPAKQPKQPKGKQRPVVSNPTACLTPKQYATLYYDGHRIGFDRDSLGVTIGGEAVNRGDAVEIIDSIFQARRES